MNKHDWIWLAAGICMVIVIINMVIINLSTGIGKQSDPLWMNPSIECKFDDDRIVDCK